MEIIFLILFLIHIAAANLENDIKKAFNNPKNNATLSRMRRYLVFPEGSSFQVVFDLTYPSVAIQGNVFMFGHTAAMAWELPATPIFLDKKKLENGKKEIENEPIMEDYPDYVHAPLNWENPGIWHNPEYHNNEFYYKEKRKRRYVKNIGVHIQRKSRRELYGKVEKLLTILRKNGKECVLKAICQVHQLPKEKGTFWQEILKSIFKSRVDFNHPDEDHYDKAANKNHDCDKMYPNCEGHVLSALFRNKTNVEKPYKN